MSAISGTSAPLTPATTVSTPSGSTVLPEASANDFGVNPSPLDEKDATYPTLIASHVAVLRSMGTPENALMWLAQSEPTAEYLDQYIQEQIFPNPEGWDSFVGNPIGTARAGLVQLIPNFNQMYGPGPAGVEGAAPGAAITTTPGVEQKPANPAEGIIKGLVLGGAAVGVGLIGHRFIKNRAAAKEAMVNAAQEGARETAKPAMMRGVVAGGGAGAAVADGAATMGEEISALLASPTSRMGDSVMRTARAAGDSQGQRTGAVLTAVGEAAHHGDDGARAGSVVHTTLAGLGPADGEMTSLTFAALNANKGLDEIVDLKVALIRARTELMQAEAARNETMLGLRHFGPQPQA